MADERADHGEYIHDKGVVVKWARLWERSRVVGWEFYATFFPDGGLSEKQYNNIVLNIKRTIWNDGYDAINLYITVLMALKTPRT